MYLRTASGSSPLGLSSRISRRFFSMYSKTRYRRFFLHVIFSSCLPFECLFELNDIFLFEHAEHLNLSEGCLLHYFIFIRFLELFDCNYSESSK